MRKTWLSDERIFKQQARERVVSCSTRQSILLLPGYRCEDLMLAISTGIITENSTVLLVEKEKFVCQQIEKWIEENWKFQIKPFLYNMLLKEMEMMPIDLGYLDYFGNLTKEDCLWIKYQLIPNIIRGCNLHFTFSMTTRGNSFIRNMQKTVKAAYHDDYYPMMNELMFEKEINDDHCSLTATYYALFKKEFFKEFDFKIEFYTYKDTCSKQTMLLISLLDLQKKTVPS